MLRKYLFVPLFFCSLAGCSGGGGGSTTGAPVANTLNSAPSIPPNFTTGKIVVTSVLLRGVPSNVDGMVFRGLDVGGQQIYGPVQVAKSSRVVLENVPTSVVRLEIDYLEGAVVRGRGSHAVTVVANQETLLNDPPFQDVTYALTGLRTLVPQIDLDRGQTQPLSFLGSYADGTEVDVTSAVDWTTSDETIAVVETGGLLRARAVGAATVTGRLGSFSQTVSVQIQPPQLVGLQVTPDEITQLEGGQVAYHLQAQLADNTSEEVQAEGWTSSNTSVASIGSDGIARAGVPGQTTIQANYQNRTGTASLNVAANETLVNLQISPADLRLPKGVNYQYTVNASYVNGTVVDLTSLATVASDDNLIAQPRGLPPVAYESDGPITVPPPWFQGYTSLIAGTGLGTTHLTATYQDLTARVAVTGVEAVPLRARVLPQGTSTLQPAGTLQLSTLTTLTDGTQETNRPGVGIAPVAHLSINASFLASAVSAGIDFLEATFPVFVTPPVAGNQAGYVFRAGDPPDYNGLAIEPTVAVVSNDLGLNLSAGPQQSGFAIDLFAKADGLNVSSLYYGARKGGNTLRINGSTATLTRTRFLSAVGVGNFSGVSGRREVFYGGVRTNSSGADYGVVLSTSGSLQLTDFSDEPLGIRDAVVGDFDGNGRSDVAYLADTAVKVRLSVAGVLDQTSTLVASGASGVTCGDLDGDGRVELIVAASGFQVFRNLVATTTVARPTGAYGSSHMTCADVDGDGRQDFCYISNRNDGNRYWNLYFGTAAGGLTAPISGTTGHRVEATDLGDVNGDGKADLVTVESSSRRTLVGPNARDCLVSIFYGSSSGFGIPQVYTLSTTSSPRDISVVTAGGVFHSVLVSMLNTQFGTTLPIRRLAR